MSNNWLFNHWDFCHLLWNLLFLQNWMKDRWRWQRWIQDWETGGWNETQWNKRTHSLAAPANNTLCWFWNWKNIKRLIRKYLHCRVVCLTAEEKDRLAAVDWYQQQRLAIGESCILVQNSSTAMSSLESGRFHQGLGLL